MVVEQNRALIHRLLDEILNVVNKMDVVDEYGCGDEALGPV